MPNTSQADILKSADLLLSGAEPYVDEPGVGDLVTELANATEGAKEALTRRNFHRSQAQQASRDAEGLLTKVKTFYERLRLVLKGRFGPISEKLAAFGLLPRRPPKPKPKEEPPEQAQSATQAATPAADSTT